MATVEGLGICPVCEHKIEVGSPARYFAGGGHGNVMAHTPCVTAHEAKINSPEYKREQAVQKLANAEAKLAAAKAHLANAKAELEALNDED